MNQYQSDTRNYVEKEDMSLGEGRVDHTAYPHGCTSEEYQQTMEGTENKVGDHHQYA